jgi:hypothetical protein
MRVDSTVSAQEDRGWPGQARPRQSRPQLPYAAGA